ncbi:MAG: hypothetical protein K5819_02760 [Lachnospiraceae bacterium]|nr:hypothetical protein [Lachnospiraceae bacterium]
MTDSQNQTDDFSGDALLVQIDAFRDKAKQLQSLIGAKQKKVVVLESLVKEREAALTEKEMKIAQLQKELDVKQAEADSLVTTVETQVDRMLSSMKGDLVHLEQEISEKIAAGNQEEAKKLADVLAKVSDSIEEIKESLAEDPDALSLEEVRRELSDKIHSENVRVYRNLTDTVKELDHAEDMNVSMEKRFQSLKRRNAVTTVLLILEFVALVFVLLGVFHVISF